MKYFLLIIILFTLVMFGCDSKIEENDSSKIDWSTSKSTEFNRLQSKEEEIDIKIYLKRRPNWIMTETGSGLQYWIYEDKEGPTAEIGNVVDVAFEVSLLDDSICYATKENELASFMVDKSDIETGVQEGIKYLSVGDKAKFIIPSHLGHGLVGDLKKIPPLQVLIVDIEVVEIK